MSIRMRATPLLPCDKSKTAAAAASTLRLSQST
jgi:hypothetical protein